MGNKVANDAKEQMDDLEKAASSFMECKQALAGRQALWQRMEKLCADDIEHVAYVELYIDMSERAQQLAFDRMSHVIKGSHSNEAYEEEDDSEETREPLLINQTTNGMLQQKPQYLVEAIGRIVREAIKDPEVEFFKNGDNAAQPKYGLIIPPELVDKLSQSVLVSKRPKDSAFDERKAVLRYLSDMRKHIKDKMSTKVAYGFGLRRSGDHYLDWRERAEEAAQEDLQKQQMHLEDGNGDDEKKQQMPMEQIKLTQILVIAIGIVEYDQSKVSCDNLPKAKEDVERYQRVFEEQYGYQFRSKCAGITAKELKAFLEKCKDDLINGMFEGTIIAFSSHGNELGVVCADGRTVSRDTIRSIFMVDALAKVARIFAFDSCRVADDGKKMASPRYRSNSKAETMMLTLMPNSTGRKVKGAKIARHLTETFKKLDTGHGAPLQEIMAKVNKGIRSASNDEQALVMNECTTDILKVVFCRDETLDRVAGDWRKTARIEAHGLIVSVKNTRTNECWGHTFVATHAVFVAGYSFQQVESAVRDGSSFRVPKPGQNLKLKIFDNAYTLDLNPRP